MKTLIITILLIIGTITTQSQIVDIYEINNSNKKISVNKYGIADINSNLELVINKEALAVTIGSKDESNTELIQELTKYNNILLHQNDILRVLKTDLSQTPYSDKIEKLGEFSNLMSDLYQKVKRDKDLRAKFNQYITEYGELPEIKKIEYNYFIEYAFSQITNEMNDNIEELKSSIDQEEINIQLTAYLNTKEEDLKKVHIENFDTYKNGEYYEVERWVTSFSKEDVKAFNETSKIATELNTLIDSNFEEISQLLENNIESYSCLNELLENVNQLINNKEIIFKTKKNLAEQFLYELKNELNIVLTIMSKVEEYDNKNENALELFNSVHNEFIDKVKLFDTKIINIITELTNEFNNDKQEFNKLIDEFNTCSDILKEDLNKVQNIYNITSTALSPFKKTALKGIEIGDEVINYSINDMPSKGFIDLLRTGKRKNQDELIIRLSVRTPIEIQNKTNGIVIEKHTISLQQIKVYTESNVSVILANPYNRTKDVKLKNKFQFAPSGSLMFKVGSRKYKTWNYLEPGIGFNLSTPDFDLDGTPEIGLGGVFTILQDVVSVGVSYNTKTDNPYWFFGLSLPFSTLGLPINKVENDVYD